MVLYKPCFAVVPAPHDALRACRAWSAHTDIPCDGVIFVDAQTVGYGGTTPPPAKAPTRLWKLKDRPTIDFAVHPVWNHHSKHRPAAAAAAPNGVWELMLRGPSNTVLSLQRFRCRCHAQTFQLPVLVQPPADCPPLHSGQVVELTCRIAGNAVEFVAMQPREEGKQPNFIWAAMDIVHAGYDVERFLDPRDGTLVRMCIRGPIREARNAFTGSVLRQAAVRSLLEIGGGSGGDLHLWLHSPGLERIDVVDPDGDALQEYLRRLNAIPVCHASRRPAFTFHCHGIFDLPDAVGWNADCAVLHFSVSQIVACGKDAQRLVHQLCGVRRIRWVVVLVHDHLVTALPDAAHAGGVACEVVRGTGCVVHPLLSCDCPGAAPESRQSATLRTRIAGTRMAADIREFAFSSEAFLSAARAVVPGLRVRLVRPFPERAHWILRSLTLMVLHNP